MSLERNISNNRNHYSNRQITSLSRDIAHAVFRVARLVRNRKLKTELESVSVDLVKDVDVEAANSLERLVRLAEVVGEMNRVNMEVLCRELAIFRKLVFGKTAEIAKFPHSGKISNIESIFGEKGGKQHEEMEKKLPDRRKKRQTEILQLIRKFPNGRQTKELSEKFPHISQRTLRNDIQILLDMGKIERFGTRVVIKGQSSAVKPLDTAKSSNNEVNADNSRNMGKEGGRTANNELSELSDAPQGQTGTESAQETVESTKETVESAQEVFVSGAI